MKFVDESDRQWFTRDKQQLVSMNQEGPIQGHYLQVDGESVSTNALASNQKTLFKMHNIIEHASGGGYNLIVLLENMNGRIVAIDKETDTVKAKVMFTENGHPTSPSKYNTLADVKNHHADALFYKVPRDRGSTYFYFKSYLKDKQRILGFDENGHALNPTKVQPNQQESLFMEV